MLPIFFEFETDIIGEDEQKRIDQGDRNEKMIMAVFLWTLAAIFTVCPTIAILIVNGDWRIVVAAFIVTALLFVLSIVIPIWKFREKEFVFKVTSTLLWYDLSLAMFLLISVFCA